MTLQERSDLVLTFARVLHVNGQSTHETVAAAERRRAYLEHEIHARIARTGWQRDPTWVARLHVSRASAHLGLLARFVRSDVAARRFVLAHALAALASWHATVPQ